MTLKADQPERGRASAKSLGRGRHLHRRLELPLASLRTAASKTQDDVAAATGIDQGDVSRLERRESLDDCLVSTLRRYMEALGAKLELVAVFPKGHRIAIAPAEKER